MYIVAIAWIYVAFMMAVAEATNMNGTVLGAIVTFILYGVAPVSLVVYLMRSPARSRANKAKRADFVAREAAYSESNLPNSLDPDSLDANSLDPNAASHSPAVAQADSIAPMREKL